MGIGITARLIEPESGRCFSCPQNDYVIGILTLDMFKHPASIALTSVSGNDGKILDFDSVRVKSDDYANCHWLIVKETDIKSAAVNVSCLLYTSPSPRDM